MSKLNLTQLYSSKQITSKEQVEEVLELAAKMEPYAKGEKQTKVLDGKIAACLFYEPSTRTRLSFETSCLRLGAKVINAIGMDNSSMKKGETIEDTMKMVENYADIIIMRHPMAKSAEVACSATDRPFLNAGDGPNQHPTQSLLDLYTIKKEQGKIDGLTIAMVGDLKFGRTVHSLMYLLKYFDVKLKLVSPKELKMPEYLCEQLKEHGIEYEETESLEDVINQVDVLYMTRVQEERFENKEEYLRLRDSFVISLDTLKNAKDNLCILHPLPRITEIKKEVDSHKAAAYFKQAGNAVPTRMALIALVMGLENEF